MAKSIKAQAAAMIRKELKANGVKATVKARPGDSIDITLLDALPATEKLVNEFAKQFELGHFNGMTDCYEYSNTRDDLPQVKFVFVDNILSDELIELAWSWARKTFLDLEGAPEKQCEAWKFETPNGVPAGQFLHHFVLNDKKSDFWSSLKPRIKLQHSA